MDKLFDYDVILGLEATENKGLVILEATEPGNIKKTYVGKCMRKAAVSPEALQKFRKEADILDSVKNGPFIIKMLSLQENEEYILLVFDMLPTQDLHSLKQIKVFTEREIKFLATEIIIGIEFLHNTGIVHRAIAPNHIGVDKEGHVAIFGFSLSEYFELEGGKLSRICGVPNFMAPEIKRKQGYDETVDWWSFAATLYYLLKGEPPSWDDDGNLILQPILFDPSEELVDLLKSLLVSNPTRRLGAEGSYEIKHHAFFFTVDWEDVRFKKVTPPALL